MNSFDWKFKKRRKDGVYSSTLRTNGPISSAFTVFSDSSAVTVICIGPKPKTKPVFAVGPDPGRILSMVPVFSRPKITNPFSCIVHSTFSASAAPILLTIALTPNPPVISPISINGIATISKTIYIIFNFYFLYISYN